MGAPGHNTGLERFSDPSYSLGDPRKAGLSSLISRLLLVVLGIAILAIIYESWLDRTPFAQAASLFLASDPRIQQEYGKVRIPISFGWPLGGNPTMVSYLRGTEASGIAKLQMRAQAGTWKAVNVVAHNLSQGHLLDLSSPPDPALPDQLHGKGRLYLVAIGTSASNEVDDLAELLRANLNLKVDVLPAMELPEQGLDTKRKQWIGEMLVGAMRSHFPDLVADLDGKIIGIIDDDMYIRGRRWPFAYSYRYGGKYAVLPTARLDPAFYRDRPSASIRQERLRKTFLKCLGILYFGIPENSNPRSLMSFESSLHDIDLQSGVFLASDLAWRAQDSHVPGKPCLTFSAANVGGIESLEPITPCLEPYDLSEKTLYQVDLASGEFRTERNDFYRDGPEPLFVRRMLVSHVYDGKVRAFGKSSWQNLDDTVWSDDPRTIESINLHGVTFRRITAGTGFSPAAKYRAPSSVGDFSNALLTWEGRWKIQGYNETWHYLGCSPNSAIPCYFVDQLNIAGDRISVERDSEGRITRALQSTGYGAAFSEGLVWDLIPWLQRAVNDGLPDSYSHVWKFTYDGPTIQRIEDNQGGSVSYAYNADGYLTDVRSGKHELTITYGEQNRMSRTVEDGVVLGVHYDQEGRVNEIDFPENSTSRIHYAGENIEVDYQGKVYHVKAREGSFELE